MDLDLGLNYLNHVKVFPIVLPNAASIGWTSFTIKLYMVQKINSKMYFTTSVMGHHIFLRDWFKI